MCRGISDRDAIFQELQRERLIDAAEIEGIGEWAHASARMLHPFAPPELLAHRLGFRAIDAEGTRDVSIGWVLVVRPCADARRRALRLLHELAHALLRLHHPDHAHGDVQALALALAVPRSALRRIDDADHVPPWALDMRRAMIAGR